MSAWYIFSSLGFYPVCPGSDWYAIGSPLVKSAVISFESGRKLDITAENQSEENVYIQKVLIDGATYSKSYIDHATLLSSKKITFILGSKPEKSRGNILPEEK
jgi:putative alpha-1,2-mannosidase